MCPAFSDCVSVDKMMEPKKKAFRFTDLILLVGLLLVGGFHEYISCALAAAMSLYLLVRMLRGKGLRLRWELLTLSVLAVCLCYGLSCFWAVDRGMAPVGFLKYLPVALYLLCLQQEEGSSRALTVLPYFGAAVAVLSGVFMHIPGLEAQFSVAGRLAGCFQYPNTFAIFLLVCELLLLKKQEKKLWDYPVLLLLLAGLLYTGSRTAFVVAVLANIAMFFALGKKQVRRVLLIGIGAVAVAAVVMLCIDGSVLRRYLTISLTESTFVGRLLYWQDALRLLVKYPMGMGFMGYYYAQQEVQTGVYSVLYVHNDFLQLMLDVGVIPGGLIFGAVIAWFFKKDVAPADKITVGALCLHSFFDFNLQFAAMFCLLLLLMDREGAKVLCFRPRLPGKLAAGVLAGVCLYMAAPLALAHWEQRPLADKLYPYNTQNKLAMLEQAQDYETALPLAEQILALNKSFYAPYSIRAAYYFSKGDYSQVIQNQRQALKQNPFSHTEYENYCKMLITGIDLYQKAGNEKGVRLCYQELMAVAQQLKDNENRLSALGKRINDQPVTELSQQVQEIIEKLGGSQLGK